MAGKMANWVAYQQRHLSEADFEAWKAGNAKVGAYLAKREGASAAARALEDFQRDMLKKVIAPGLEKASNLLADVERMSAIGLSKTGLLEKSIGSIKAKLYPATFCGYIASGPRRGYARAQIVNVTAKGNKLKTLGKKKTELLKTVKGFRIANPVAYAQIVTKGRKAVKAKNKKSLMSATGQFFGKSVGAAKPKNFMSAAQAGTNAAAEVATQEMNIRIQQLTK